MEMSSPLSQLVDETVDEDLSELELGEQASSETPTSGDQEEAAPSAPEALLEDAPVDADTGTPEINPQEMMSETSEATPVGLEEDVLVEPAYSADELPGIDSNGRSG